MKLYDEKSEILFHENHGHIAVVFSYEESVSYKQGLMRNKIKENVKKLNYCFSEN